MKQFVRNYMKWFFLVLYTGYIGCVSLFEHSHTVDGVTVVHAHPFSKDIPHDHKQNKTIIYFIQSLSALSVTNGAISVLDLAYHAPFIDTLSYGNHYDSLRSNTLIGGFFLRPPPLV